MHFHRRHPHGIELGDEGAPGDIDSRTGWPDQQHWQVEATWQDGRATASVTEYPHPPLSNGPAGSVSLGEPGGTVGALSSEQDQIVSISIAINDPSYTAGRQWDMQGDRSALANAYGSQAAEAWSAGVTGSMKQVVGIVDTGIDYTHVDLYQNVWLNQNEIPLAFRAALRDVDGDSLITFRDLNDIANASFVADKNGNGYIDGGDLLNDARWEDGVDTDGNGYRDDLVGWDFVNNDNDPFDDNGHGTHVSGTIGAVGGNGTGIAGENWQVQMIGLKFLAASGSGSLSAAIQALDYFTRMAAATPSENFVATNNSWGGGSYTQSLLDAIVRAARQDILFIAAAGNGGSDGIGDNNDTVVNYPSNYSTAATVGWESVVAVASLTSTGALSSFSNYGRSTVDLAAPGSSIYSTLPGNSYGTYSGTSMATPHATGAAALFAYLYPNATAAEIRAAMLNTALSTSSVVNKVASNGRLDISGMIGAGALTIESTGHTTLSRVGNWYFVNDGAIGGLPIKLNGTEVGVGQTDAWVAIGAESSAGTYKVAWRYGGADQYVIWNLDAGGNFTGSDTGITSGGSYALELGETSLGQDLNGDGTIGVVSTRLEGAGSTFLTLQANRYALLDDGGAGPALHYNGADVTLGSLGVWQALGAELSGSEYVVAWRNGSADQYVLWRTDLSGNYLGGIGGSFSGGSTAMAAAEGVLHQDLNLDGSLGAVLRTIESAGSITLKQVADEFALFNGATQLALLRMNGTDIVSSQMGSWTPLGAEAVTGGYKVAWKFGAADQYVVWNVDAGGNFTGTDTGIVSGGSYQLEVSEAVLSQDLNADGTVGVVTARLESAGSTFLTLQANRYALLNGGGAGPALHYNGADVTTGSLGAWQAIGAEVSGSEYVVAWRYGSADQYVLWRTDASGNFLSGVGGSFNGSSAAMASAETTLHQDINGDGVVAAALPSLSNQLL